jgi:hypothetical protein
MVIGIERSTPLLQLRQIKAGIERGDEREQLLDLSRIEFVLWDLCRKSQYPAALLQQRRGNVG